jgi:cysteine desulfurase / selenocysteine lyase
LNYTIDKIRKDFPILKEKVYNKPLIYFDNAATTQKPQRVIDVIDNYYSRKNSTIHRGVHHLSSLATEDYENARSVVQQFLNARKSHEIIFTSGTTASINGLAFSLGEILIHEGDEIIITEMEHHANIVPWQMLCERKQAHLKYIPFDDNGELKMGEFENLISDRTKLVALTHVSNALGTVNPVKEIIATAHKYDIPVVIDAAQSVQHMKVDVTDMDCDFLVLSGHKIYGPTGIGVLYGKEEWLDRIPPFMGGGDMVDKVTFEKTTYNILPFKLEAGTTNYIGAIGMREALLYVNGIGLENIHAYEQELLQYATQEMSDLEGIHIYGNASEKSSVISFLMDGVHMLDAGMVLDKMGIALRTGTHCAQPVMQHFNIDGTLRVSLGLYNTKEEIDYLCQSLDKTKSMFS